MAEIKIENGTVRYLFRTFDGTFTEGRLPADSPILKGFKDSSAIPGFGKKNGEYFFETEEVEEKPSKKKTKE